MPSYTEEDLDDLESAAEEASFDDQTRALALAAKILEQNNVAYGVMRGMNFALRGSQCMTGDVDIAVDNPPRMDALLRFFDNRAEIYRPLNKMQWVSGVARIFIRIQGQLVQLDLKPKGAERHLIPRDIASSVDRTTVQTSTGVFDCYLLAVGPLVAAKIKSHYNRMTDDDYFDLLFVCQSLELAPLVRQYSAKFREDWKDCFLERVIETDPMDETQVRWALGMDRTPSPPGRHDRSVSDESDTVSALTQCLDQFHPQDYNKPYYVITYFSHNGNICFTDVGGMYKEDEVSSWTGSSILYQGETVPCFMYVDPPTARQYYTWTLGGGQR